MPTAAAAITAKIQNSMGLASVNREALSATVKNFQHTCRQISPVRFVRGSPLRYIQTAAVEED
jgi:hypothetical protein